MTKKNKYNYIIWDWNGTLYDDVDAGMDTVNDMLVLRGLPILSKKKYRRIFTFPIIDYYVKAGFDFSVEPYEVLAAEFIQKNNERLGESCLYPNAIRTLREIKSRGIHQLILSASRKDILMEQMAQFKIQDYFCTVLGMDNFYAFGKEGIAKTWLFEHAMDAKKVLLIGDTAHDFEVASSIGCDCVLIKNGHQAKSILMKTGVPVLSKIKDVLDLI